MGASQDFAPLVDAAQVAPRVAATFKVGWNTELGLMPADLPANTPLTDSTPLPASTPLTDSTPPDGFLCERLSKSGGTASWSEGNCCAVGSHGQGHVAEDFHTSARGSIFVALRLRAKPPEAADSRGQVRRFGMPRTSAEGPRRSGEGIEAFAWHCSEVRRWLSCS